MDKPTLSSKQQREYVRNDSLFNVHRLDLIEPLEVCLCKTQYFINFYTILSSRIHIRAGWARSADKLLLFNFDPTKMQIPSCYFRLGNIKGVPITLFICRNLPFCGFCFCFFNRVIIIILFLTKAHFLLLL